MTRRRLARLCSPLLPLALFALSGCSAPERASEAVADLPPLPAAAVRPDPGVERSLETRLHGVTRRDGRLVADLHLMWTGEHAERLLWTVEWFDREGAAVPDPTAGWRPLEVMPASGVRLELVAPAASAESWRLHFARAEG